MEKAVANLMFPEKEYNYRESNSKLTGRRYDIIGYRHSGENTEFLNVAANKANAIRAQLRKEGCYRVDKIEVVTKVKGKELEFTEKSYVPALEGRIPNPITATENKIADDRAKMRAINNNKIARANNSSKETRTDLNQVYEKETGKLVFMGTLPELHFFIMNRMEKSREHYVFYLPSKMVNGKGVNND